jgi:predicted Holliday junction resolvase-like endonuclease
MYIDFLTEKILNCIQFCEKDGLVLLICSKRRIVLIAKLFGCFSLILVTIVGLLYWELRKSDEKIGQMETTLSVFEDANKNNLKELTDLKENQKVLEEQRIAREKAINKLNEELDKKILEVNSEKSKDPVLSSWYDTVVPDYIRLRNNANPSSHSNRK